MLLKLPSQKDCGLTSVAITVLIGLLKEKKMAWDAKVGLAVVKALQDSMGSPLDSLRAVSFLRIQAGLDVAAMTEYKQMVNLNADANDDGVAVAHLLNRLDDFATLGSETRDHDFFDSKASQLLVEEASGKPLSKEAVAANAKRLRKVLWNNDGIRRHVEEQFWLCRKEGKEYVFAAAWEAVCMYASGAMDKVYAVVKEMGEGGREHDAVALRARIGLDDVDGGRLAALLCLGRAHLDRRCQLAHLPRQRPLRWDELAVIEQRARWEKSTEARDEVGEQALTAAVQHPRPPIDQLARQWLRGGNVGQCSHVPDGSGRFRLVGHAPAGYGRRLFQPFHLITVVHSLREEDGRGGSLWHARNSTRRHEQEARTKDTTVWTASAQSTPSCALIREIT
jgi:hypothetical protein